MKRFFWVLVLLLALGAAWAGSASAQQPTPSDDQVNAIARQLFCPVCQNTPLDVCPTEACHQWRELIRQMLAEGKSEAYIKQYFVDNYGARVLAEPPQSGFNWLIYIVPPVAFLAGAFLLYRAYRTWQRMEKESAAETSSAPGPASAVKDEYVDRLEEELRKRR
jgi:cytochrome c-type biogenesis protein CcmH